MGNVMIPEDVATLAGGPEPIGPPGEPPMAPPGGPPMGGPPMGGGGLEGLLGGGGPPMGGPGMGPEGPPPEGMPEEGGGGSEVDILSEMLESAMEYMRVASDDIEKEKMMRAAAIVQGLLASNQKEAEMAGGIGPAQKGMAKAIGSMGGGGGF